MGPGLLGIGGSRADGLLTNAWAPTLPGYYDFDGSAPSVLSSGRALPYFTCLRHQGDLTISATQTLDKIARADITSAEAFGLVFGNQGGDDDGSGSGGSLYGGGGANAGAGGNAGRTTGGGFGGGARDYANLLRWWVTKSFPAGGVGGDSSGLGGSTGGVCIIMVEGDLDMTGGTINAAGGTAAGAGGGGGAGGTIIALCTGTLTGGTFVVSGGAANNSQNGGGGGGGVVALVASAFAGSQTFTKTGGSGGHGGGNPSGSSGGAGYSTSVVLAPEFLRGLYWR